MGRVGIVTFMPEHHGRDVVVLADSRRAGDANLARSTPHLMTVFRVQVAVVKLRRLMPVQVEPISRVRWLVPFGVPAPTASNFM